MGDYVYDLVGWIGTSPVRFEKAMSLEEMKATVEEWKKEPEMDFIVVEELDRSYLEKIRSKTTYHLSKAGWRSHYFYIGENEKI